MTVKNILVAYSGWRTAQDTLNHAIKIAKHHDAWVTGIIGHGRSQLVRLIGSHAPKDVLEMMQNTENEEIEGAKKIFEETVKKHGRHHASEVIDVFDEDGVTIASFARSFDLVVTAPHNTSLGEEHMSASPDMIALQSGRPVLIVPKHFESSGLSVHVVVAWDGKRASARAIGDAMPMLEEKGKVTVLTIGEKTPSGTSRLIQNLARHDINAEHLQQSKSGSIGASILNAREKLGADLIVMGAYEHSKFAHDVFGGVTTDVLRDSKVPVLMSH